MGDSTFIATGLADLSSGFTCTYISLRIAFFQLYALPDGLWSGHLAGPLADLLAEVRHPLLPPLDGGYVSVELTLISQRQAIKLH